MDWILFCAKHAEYERQYVFPDFFYLQLRIVTVTFWTVEVRVGILRRSLFDR